MTYVCLWIPATPTGAASAAELAPLLLEKAPRIRVTGSGTAEPSSGAAPPLLWADARGLQARSLAEALLAVLRTQGYVAPPPRAGIAATPVAAEVAARYATGTIVEVPAGGDRAFLAPYPIAVLHPEPDLAALLDGTGLECCGELAQLDRASVELRFGAAGVALWRLARADDRRLLFGPPPAPLSHASLEWTDYVLTDPERLLFAINRLVQSVCGALREQGQGARRFTLVFELDRGGAVERPFHPSRTSADERAWLRLIRHDLERLTLPDAVSGLVLRVDAAAPSERVQGDLLDRGFATAREAEAALAKVLDRDGVVLTPRNNRHPLLRRRTTWVAEPSTLVWARPQIAPGDTEPCLALHLLPEPEPIEVITVERRGFAAPVRYRERDGWHTLLAASGPDCVSGGRWEDAYAYEFYCCVRADGELVQLARDARRNQWVLHGRWR